MRSYIEVLGVMWMPRAPGATTYNLRPAPWDDIRDLRDDDGDITRESVSLWLDTHSGDFSEVTDFSAVIDDQGKVTEIPWSDEGNGITFTDIMYPQED